MGQPLLIDALRLSTSVQRRTENVGLPARRPRCEQATRPSLPPSSARDAAGLLTVVCDPQWRRGKRVFEVSKRLRKEVAQIDLAQTRPQPLCRLQHPVRKK